MNIKINKKRYLMLILILICVNEKFAV